MATKSKRHPHKYYRVELSEGNIVWACAAGDCPHHMPPHYTKLMLNKDFECWQCGAISRILPEHLELNSEFFMPMDDVNFPSHPRCRKCALGTLSDEETLDKILKEIGE